MNTHKTYTLKTSAVAKLFNRSACSIATYVKFIEDFPRPEVTVQGGVTVYLFNEIEILDYITKINNEMDAYYSNDEFLTLSGLKKHSLKRCIYYGIIDIKYRSCLPYKFHTTYWCKKYVDKLLKKRDFFSSVKEMNIPREINRFRVIKDKIKDKVVKLKKSIPKEILPNHKDFFINLCTNSSYVLEHCII